MSGEAVSLSGAGPDDQQEGSTVRLCAECSPNPQAWAEVTAPPGRCSECDRPFDLSGMPINDDRMTCPFHDPILASCPHAEADVRVDAIPTPSWLDEAPSQK